MMDKRIVGAFLAVAIASCLSGCAAFALRLNPVTVIGRIDRKPNLVIGSITVDKQSGGRSIEREIKRILPALLEDKGFVVVEEPTAAFSVDVLVIEREFISGTSNVRSLMVEIALIDPQGAENPEPAVIARKTVQGTPTSASSGDLFTLLSMTIDALAKKGVSGGDNGGKSKPPAASSPRV